MALPSAIMRTLPPAFWSLPHAPITKASLTETHHTSSTFLALSLSMVGDVARHVLPAGRGEGPGQPEDHDALALGEVRHLERVRAHGAARAYLFDELGQGSFGKLITDFDRHGDPPRKNAG